MIAAGVLRYAEDHDGVIDWPTLSDFGLPDGSSERLVDPGRRGIWNPKSMSATLSILTVPNGPYTDREEAGFLHFSFQKGREGGKNVKLAAAKELGLPILRLHWISKGLYQPIFPVFVVDVNPTTREFTLSLDEHLRAVPDVNELSPIERHYAERLVQQRVHQPRFRAQVMLAYENRCCVCSLGHPPLLDAAHISRDSDEDGTPVVSNGLSLCKIHHAAYDRLFLGIDSHGGVRINQRLLDEVDGPMLRHGLQDMHGGTITQPHKTADRPDPLRLEARYE